MFSLSKKGSPALPQTQPQSQLGQVPWLRIATLAFGVFALYVLSQVIMAAVSAALGLAAIGILGIVGVGVFQALPMLAQKWENRILMARVAEARRNPIEQATNDFLRRQAQFERFKAAVSQIGGQIASLKVRLKKMHEAAPKSDFSTEEDALGKMDLYYKNRLDRVTLASAKLQDFDQKIKEARMKWDFQVAANQAIVAMNATDREAQMNQMLTEIAFDTVQHEFDEVFAKIDVDAAELNSKKELAFGGGMSLDLSAIQIPQLETAGAH